MGRLLSPNRDVWATTGGAPLLLPSLGWDVWTTTGGSLTPTGGGALPVPRDVCITSGGESPPLVGTSGSLLEGGLSGRLGYYWGLSLAGDKLVYASLPSRCACNFRRVDGKLVYASLREFTEIYGQFTANRP